MSTLLSQPAPLPQWKEEVNRRLAAHKNRKGQFGAEKPAATGPHVVRNGKAAQAAARVAERYAKAPSFSEMQAAEARAAMRAAEAATRKALEAQAAAQAALFELEAAAAEEAARAEEAEMFASEAGQEDSQETAEVPIARAPLEGLEIRWEPDMPAPPVAPPMAYAHHETKDEPETRQDWWRNDEFEMERSLAPVEPAQPIPANLIEFPRELVATRRIRPRISGANPNGTGDLFDQLSIFEVDPSTISIDPPAVPTEAAEPEGEWTGPKWSSIELDEQPAGEFAFETNVDAEAPELELAPTHRRVLAALVDTTLVMGATCAAAAWAAQHMQHAPTMKTAELSAIGTVFVLGVLYHALFLLLAGRTPGMWYAQIGLRDFENEKPSRAQVRGRLLAMLLSMLPVGLGLVWAVFDDDHLSWHDRLSRTYLRAG